MKRLLFLLFSIPLLSSCLSMEQVTTTEFIDYSRFHKNGMFITEANNVDFDYTPLGSVISVTRGAFRNIWSFSVDKDKALSDIGKELKAKGADGLINMRVSNSYINYYYYTTITGMAIKRKDTKDLPVKTYKEKLGAIDGITVEVMEAYQNGTRIITSEKMNKNQIRKVSKRYFYNQPQVQFYTPDGWVRQRAYAAIIDKKIVDYETNELTPL